MLVYRPILKNDNKGPFSSQLQDSLLDILMDLNENQNENQSYSDGKLTEIAESLSPLLTSQMSKPGTYPVFENYSIEIQEMNEEQYNTLHEFHGY